VVSIPIPIAIMVPEFAPALLALFIEIAARYFRLTAARAVAVNLLSQILFSLVNPLFTLLAILLAVRSTYSSTAQQKHSAERRREHGRSSERPVSNHEQILPRRPRRLDAQAGARHSCHPLSVRWRG
jgi:hypothetical protein